MSKRNPEGKNHRKGVKNANKEPIKVRFKELANGNQSIYLDYYNNSRREYQFLKLYLVPEKTSNDKAANAQTLNLANAVKAQKIVELQNTAHGFKFSDTKQKARLVNYLQAISDEKKQEGKREYMSYNLIIKHVKQYSGDKTTFKQITREYCKGFIDYLKTAENAVYKKNSDVYSSGLLSENTKRTYINLLGVALNRAVRDGILQNNPFSLLQRYELPKLQSENREYLTIDEVKQLVKTPCHKPTIKNAFLFTCFSGLRYSDVGALTWGQLQTDNDGKTVLKYTQKKTQKVEKLQLSDEALKFLPERSEAKDDDIIFKLNHNGYNNVALKSWASAAGITKRVTFHIGRHTNATLLLSLGVPIETVSKILGHSKISQTQIYAKVIDKNKRAAVDKLDGLTD